MSTMSTSSTLRTPRTLRTLATLVLAVTCATATAHAQWLNYKTPGVPRTPDGKPKLDAPAPRGPDGHPDLSGVWMHEMTPMSELRRLYGARIDNAEKTDIPGMEIGTQHKYVWNILIDFPDRDAMVKPQTAPPAPRRQGGSCAPGRAVAGFPVAGLLSEPIKIVQAPKTTVILYEVGNDHRQIYTDGRRLPAEINLPAYFGYSVGRWDGDTFVVESFGFNDQTGLDAGGHRHSDQLRVTERLRRRDFGHLDYEMTFDDPKTYTRPFTIRVPHNLLPDEDIFEMFPENEKDCAHMKP
ncbi:MAG TPA: hypothetical protein VN628_19745 [Vicinamibacterales bacterium]|nr:hypothetical protein [Vicinamibacterales bacterium]